MADVNGAKLRTELRPSLNALTQFSPPQLNTTPQQYIKTLPPQYPQQFRQSRPSWTSIASKGDQRNYALIVIFVVALSTSQQAAEPEMQDSKIELL